MKNTLRYAVQIKKEKLINKMIQSGIYKKNNKHLYELTLTDLESVYKDIANHDLNRSIPTDQ